MASKTSFQPCSARRRAIDSISATLEVGALFYALSALAPAIAQTPPALQLQLQPAATRISVTSEPGVPCTVQYATNLPASAWFPLTNLTFTGATTQVVDAVSGSALRYYRAQIVVPTNMVWVSAGTFLMGSPTNENERSTSETRHAVTLSRGFFIGAYQVTQSSYLSLLSTNPSYFGPSNGFTADLRRPVEQVSWSAATNYCAALTRREQAAGRIFTNWVYRLPTEAEWEFACRAGTTNAFYLGSSLHSGMANFDGRYEYVGGTGTVFNAGGVFTNRTVPVGGYAANPLGLYDMAGNVWEWCQDWYGAYPTNSVTDPQGPTNGVNRVFRGGSLNASGKLCRSANRNDTPPNTAVNTIGFRVVLSAGP
jgi:formylglycine-generating enzyme required for sulfatase activity